MYKGFVLVFALISALCFPFKQVQAQDADKNKQVDLVDFSIWKGEYLRRLQTIRADFNKDNNVDLVDFGIWKNGYLNSSEFTNILSISTAPQTTGMWISRDEVKTLPASGEAWNTMKSQAYGNWGTTNMADQDNKFGLSVLAGALVYVRTNDEMLRSKVRDGIIKAKRTMDETSEWKTTNGVLSLGRQLGAFVIAADLIDLKYFDSVADSEFRSWLKIIRTTNVGTHGRWRNLTFTCENSANNWGTFACPSRIAASIYLGDTVDVQRSANIIRAWVGEREYYPGDAPGEGGYFQHTADHSPSWICNVSTWTAVNPSCVRDSVNLDGSIVEDASRGGGCCTVDGNGVMYSWEALQGLFVSTELLYRTGKFGNPYNWSNNSLKRSLDFMQRSGWKITSPSQYVPWMANKRYATNFPTSTSTSGRIMSWGDWLYNNN